MKPLVLGLSRTRLTDAERALFEHAAPAGYILFQRNIETPEQLRRALDEAVASGKPTLINAVIDETAGTESGRITSLNPTAAKKK